LLTYEFTNLENQSENPMRQTSLDSQFLQSKEVFVYLVLTSVVICGLLASIVTAPKLMHFGLTFPFANIVFSVFTYPVVDCICELWGKNIARQTVGLGLLIQSLFALIIHISIAAPHATFWQLQTDYALILGSSGIVVFASLAAFSVSQLLDVFIYQRIKEATRGKWLWLRSNISIYSGQIIDSIIFVLIVFNGSNQKFQILFGSVIVKILVGFIMTPIIYLLVISINRFLNYQTLAFKPI